MKFIKALLVLACTILLNSDTQATTYYVSKTASNGYAVGSNSNSCAQAQNKSTPKNTISGSSTAALEHCTSGGDTIIVNEGTYTQQITNPPAGTASAYTTIKADPSSTRPLLRPNGSATQRGFYCDTGSNCRYIRLEGFDVSGAYNSVKLAFGTVNGATTYPHHLQFVNNIFCNTRSTNFETNTDNNGLQGGNHLIQGNEFCNTGIYYPDDHSGALYSVGHNTIYNPGSGTIIEQNTFHNLTNGVGIWHSNKYLYDIIIRHNRFYNIGRHLTDTWMVAGGSAIHVSSGGGRHQIYGNVIYISGDGSGFDGIRVNPQFGKTSIQAITIYNNTVYDLKDAAAEAIKITSNVQVSNIVTVKNNLMIQTNGIGDSSSGAMVSSHNRTTGTASAIWTSPSTGDFTLKSGSAAIDAGTNVGLAYVGTSPDQGAYEVPTFASCEVIAGASSKVRIRFNTASPLVPESSITGVTIRRNGVNNPILSSTRVGDNAYDVTVTNAYGTGTPVDISLTASSTNIGSTALGSSAITPYQLVIASLTNQSCTNSLPGEPPTTPTGLTIRRR